MAERLTITEDLALLKNLPALERLVELSTSEAAFAEVVSALKALSRCVLDLDARLQELEDNRA